MAAGTMRIGMKAMLLTCLGIVLFGAGVIGTRAAVRKLRDFDAETHVVQRPAEDWVAVATDISLETRRGVTVRGWRLVSRNGAGVLLATGWKNDRRQLLPEARILSNAGYGVLMFDLPGNGESGGRRFRGDEQDAVRAAVDALASSQDIQPGRLGAYGFSTGGAVLAEIAAIDDRLRAIVFAGTFTDTNEFILHEYRHWGPLSAVPALAAAHAAGLVPARALKSMPLINPRPVFIIQGDEDTVINSDSAERLFAAAREPKQLWRIPHASHGDYVKIAGEEYAHRLVAFYEKWLLGVGAPEPRAGHPVDFAGTPIDRVRQ